MLQQSYHQGKDDFLIINLWADFVEMVGDPTNAADPGRHGFVGCLPCHEEFVFD